MTKDEKRAQKTFKEISESMAYLGECQCGGHLITFTSVPAKYRFTIYCTECGSVSDIRFPKAGDVFNVKDDEHPINLLDRIFNAQRGSHIPEYEIQNTPISENVNDKHGAI